MITVPVKNVNSAITVDDEDHERTIQHTWHLADSGVVRSSSVEHYLCIANFIMCRTDTMYDHRDRDPFNNQKSNLREATQQQNCFNRTKRKGTSSIYKGVSKIGYNRFVANIGINGKMKYLGSFKTSKEAALAYNKAATELFGEFAAINIL